jgi:hypothetical protein
MVRIFIKMYFDFDYEEILNREGEMIHHYQYLIQ